jgi:hypothetical protein
MIDRRPTLILAAFVFSATLAVYGSMLSSNVAVGDEAEAQTVPYILGIAHPTGFPAYTLAGWVFSHALPFGTVAWRLNAFTAVSTALSVTGIFLIAEAIAGDLAAAVLAAFVFAFGATVWDGALHANAQALAGACSIWALLAGVIFARCGGTRALVAACALCGLGIATHPSAIWVVPAIAVALAWQRKGVAKRALAFGLAALLLPLLLYAYLPLRSAVVAAHGLDPSAATPLYGAGNFDWNTNAPRTPAGFLDEVLARHVGAGSQLARAFDPSSISGAPQFWFEQAAGQYRFWLLLLAAAGFATLAWVDRRALSVLAAGTLGGVSFAYVYRADTQLDRYVFVSFAVAAALSAGSVRLRLPRLPGTWVRAVSVVALAVLAGFAFAQNRPRAASIYEDGETIISAVRQDTPDGAIVVAQWNDAAALGYGTFVEHALGSRIIVAGWPSDYADQYTRWAESLPVRLFVSPLAMHRLLGLPVRLWPQPSSLGGYGIYAVLPFGALPYQTRTPRNARRE